MPSKARQMQHGDGESSRSYSLVPAGGGGGGVAAAISRRRGELSAWPQQGGRGPWVGVWGRWPRWRIPGPEMGPPALVSQVPGALPHLSSGHGLFRGSQLPAFSLGLSTHLGLMREHYVN